MLEVTQQQVVQALETLGIKEGDGLLVHSAIHFLGYPRGGVGMYLDAIRSVIGQQGTLAVPAFNFNFATSARFDPKVTPSKGMGIFSEYVRQQTEARRTLHPMQSLVVLGYYTEDLTLRDTPSAFDPGSAFERMLELDFKLLLLGADIQSVSMLHYSEQRADVPYRFWKDFSGQIRAENDWEHRTYRMFVRDLDFDPRISLRPVLEYLQYQKQWSSISLNYGEIATCRLKDFVTAVDHFLNDNPWSLVTNRTQ